MNARFSSSIARILALVLVLLMLSAFSGWTPPTKSNKNQVFNRIASFPVYQNTDIELETVAEIVAATPNGRTLVYTDAETESIGFVNISDPSNPQPLGAIELDGEPTSVAVTGSLAFVGVNTSPDFVNPSGQLVVIEIFTQTILQSFDLPGQPDSLAASKNGRYVAIVLENERDEDLGDGEPPQLPGGALVVVDVYKASSELVDLTGVADLFPEDAEPEYVDINNRNIAVVTLQENNHIALVDLKKAELIADFPAGTVDLDQIDILEEDFISLTGSLEDVPREPDAVTWVSNKVFATADEGDLFGGSRGFTLFDTNGNTVYEAGNTVEHIAARLGHYPDARSENKGSEPEGIEYARYRSGKYLFVGLERSSLVLVYKLKRNTVEYVQALPTGIGPEGLLALPQRDLFVVASEVDNPGGVRSIITLYKLESGPADYPTILSADSAAGTPITWGALSGLTTDLATDTVYAVRDSFYIKSAIYTVDASAAPAIITDETFLVDSSGLLAAISPDQVNEDGTVNLDPEGIAMRADGNGFWVAQEGRGTIGDEGRPFEFLNLILGVDADGNIDDVITLPESVNDRQVRFGFEGVTSTGEAGSEVLFVAFQREWADDPDDQVRIGRYDVASGEWTFYYYPIEMPAASGWVGLSEITALDDETFLIVERDNQSSVTAAIKRIYKVSVAGVTPQADMAGTPTFPVLEKELVRDLLPDFEATGGQVLDKVEGLTVQSDGTVLVVTDNDGVDDSSGETQFLRLSGLVD